MVEYFKSPAWTTEICDYIDDHCLIFGGDVDTENSLEFTQIHKKFKKLIEKKLDVFCGEFGIEHTHFVQACSKISGNKQHSKCLEQLIAVENFILFKKMMI